jgi:1-acyl-sn-glycerol-3-phosphate acyltransferase
MPANNPAMYLQSMGCALRVFADTYKYVRPDHAQSPSHAEQKQAWGREMLALLGIKVIIKGKPSTKHPLILVGNHISYLDIVLLFAMVPEVSFVAKEELAHWPIFGAGARKAGTIFLKRGNASARSAVRDTIRDALLVGQKRIALFPAGTTRLDESVPWKFGAFRLAHETGVPMQVFRVRYTPLRRAAYIDKDFFPLHLLGLCNRNSPVKASLEFAPSVKIRDPERDCLRWQEWAAGS